jgi:uncharacterized protein YlxP (DUF503 family)
MYVLALEVDLRIPQARSLKDKRQVVRHLLDSSRSRFSVSAAEVGEQDDRQRARLGFAVVASTAALADGVITSVERHVWSHPDLEVLSTERSWVETA